MQRASIRWLIRLAWPLVAVSLVSCSSSDSTTSTPLSPPTVMAAGWGVGLCVGAGGWKCASHLTFEGEQIKLTSATSDGPSLASEASLTPRGIAALQRMANEVLFNPPGDSGGCGVTCDGLTFSLTVGSSGSAQWSGTWGWEKRPSEIHAMYDRFYQLVQRIAACEDDPWASVGDGCSRIPAIVPR